MICKDQIKEILSLLRKYELFWSKEILNYYPGPLEYYPKEWILELQKLNSKELWKLDIKEDFSPITAPSLKDFLERVKNLERMPQISTSKLEELPTWAFVNVREKKRHEISKLVPLIKGLHSEHNYSHLVDIGGGVGHTSRIVSHYFGLDSICLDKNEKLQKIGKVRVKKYPVPKRAKSISFINLTFGESEADAKIFSPEALSLGLHTCGPLALSHFNTAIKNNTKGIINFGCCYARLNPQKDTNISKAFKAAPIPFTRHSLDLATRSHAEMSFDEYLFKERVKNYRYALHLFTYHELGIREFKSVGNAHHKLYQKDFSTYALEKLKCYNLKKYPSQNELQSFYNSDSIQSLINQMYLSNILRWQLGRLVEIALLYDRKLYLEENGYQTIMGTLFHEKLSPRNISIVAQRV